MSEALKWLKSDRVHLIEDFTPDQFGPLYKYISYARLRNDPSESRKRELNMIEEKLIELDQSDDVEVENEINVII